MRTASRPARSSSSRPKTVPPPARSPTTIPMPKPDCSVRSRSAAGNGRSRIRRTRAGLQFEALGAAGGTGGMGHHSGAGRGEVTAKGSFILANTEILSPPLVPEIKLHLASESVPLWQKTEAEFGRLGLEPPFWAFAWAGGQGLARYVLDRPDIVRRRSVVDLATGSGLVAIAAAKAGARHVLAADIDEFAREATSLNAAINGIAVTIAGDDLLGGPPPAADIILVGDLFYEQ